MRHGDRWQRGFEHYHHLTLIMDNLICFVIGLFAVTVVGSLIMKLVTFMALFVARAAILFAKIGAAAVLMLVIKGGLLLQGKVQEVRPAPAAHERMASITLR